MAITIRDAYGNALAKYGRENTNVVVLDADVSSSTKSGIFAQACPGRFFNVGIAEANMIAMAAGMATEGKIPFVNTFAVFISTLGTLGARTLAGYGGAPVKFMGAYGGVSDAYDGATHHSVEDIAIMRAIPGITVLVASDANLTDWIVKTAINTSQAMYVRLSRDAMPSLYGEDEDFEIGKGKVIKDGKDITIVACGIMSGFSLQAAERLAEEGISVRVVDMFSIKPIDKELIEQCARETRAIITAEEHSVIGGLGSAVAEILARLGAGIPMDMIGIPDCYTQSGSYNDLLAAYELNVDSIIKRIRKLLA